MWKSLVKLQILFVTLLDLVKKKSTTTAITTATLQLLQPQQYYNKFFISIIIIIKQYLSLLLNASLSLLSSLSTTTTAIFVIVRILFNYTVINFLSILMNDFRTKSLFQSKPTASICINKQKLIKNFNYNLNKKPKKHKIFLSKIDSNSNSATIAIAAPSSLTSLILLSSLLIQTIYNCCNFLKKSNKVFLNYITCDDVNYLRVFNRRILNLYQLLFKSFSELKITEDLCNYGELIGGNKLILKQQQQQYQELLSTINKNNNNNNTNNNNNNNNNNTKNDLNIVNENYKKIIDKNQLNLNIQVIKNFLIKNFVIDT